MNRAPEVVVITGASAGVGRAAAREFARHRCTNRLFARRTDGLNAARREVRRTGTQSACHSNRTIADADQVESAVAQIEAELGHIKVDAF